MERAELYRDIALRTQGDIYLGVVGPVRTGKSTFIKRFMDTLVIPEIENEYVKKRVVDELPQSGSGRTVMTTQPKFVPNDAVTISISGSDAELSVRMIDCVGYMVEGALGGDEDDGKRMVRTPWFDHEIPFDEAAELGTRKVITEHSTVGVVVLTDGSILGIPREAYAPAEEKVFAELKRTGKPFAVILNSTRPSDAETRSCAVEIGKKYGVEVLTLNVLEMTAADINALLENLLMDFPMRSVFIETPRWMTSLGEGHPLVGRAIAALRERLPEITRMRDYRLIAEALTGLEDLEEPEVSRLTPGDGSAVFRLTPKESVFFRILSEECGYDIADESELLSSLRGLVFAKKEYDRVSSALNAANDFGYGLVPPKIDEMQLEKPEIIRSGNRFGVKLKARASGLHLIRVDIESEVNPLVGTAEQGEELAGYLMSTFEKNPDELWRTNIFGKPIYDLVKDGMSGKINALPQDVQMKLRDTINRMVNEGCRGLVCILL
jgi:stage IV sporulation protein A